MHWRIQQWWYNALHHPLLWYNALSGHGQLVIHCIVSPTTVIQCIELSRPVIAMIHPSDHFIALYHSSGWYNAMYHIAIQPHNYSCPTLGRSPPNGDSLRSCASFCEQHFLLMDSLWLAAHKKDSLWLAAHKKRHAPQGVTVASNVANVGFKSPK